MHSNWGIFWNKRLCLHFLTLTSNKLSRILSQHHDIFTVFCKEFTSILLAESCNVKCGPWPIIYWLIPVRELSTVYVSYFWLASCRVLPLLRSTPIQPYSLTGCLSIYIHFQFLATIRGKFDKTLGRCVFHAHMHTLLLVKYRCWMATRRAANDGGRT